MALVILSVAKFYFPKFREQGVITVALITQNLKKILADTENYNLDTENYNLFL